MTHDKHFSEGDFPLASHEARYIAKKTSTDVYIFHCAYAVKGGYYILTTDKSVVSSDMTLIATFHNPYKDKTHA